MSRICSYPAPTTGAPCENTVADGEDHCAAGHPCPPAASSSRSSSGHQASGPGAAFDLEDLADGSRDGVAFNDWDDALDWSRSREIRIASSFLNADPSDPKELEPMARAIDRFDQRYPGIVRNVYEAQPRVDRFRTDELCTLGEFPRQSPSIMEIPDDPTSRSILRVPADPGRLNPESVCETEDDNWAHEMAHVVAFKTPGMRFHPDVPSGRKQGSMIRTAMKKAGYTDWRGRVKKDTVASDVSPEAAKTDLEFHAEVFTLVNRPGGVEALSPEAQGRLRKFQSAMNKIAGEKVV